MRARELSAAAFASSSSLAVAALAVGAAVACSSSEGAPAVAPGTDAQASTDAPSSEAADDAALTGPTQKGRIIDAVGKTGIAGAVVTIGGATATTGEDGTYTIPITKNVPTSMVVTAPDHYKLNEQQWIVKSDLFDRGDSSLLSESTANLLAGILPQQDPAKGYLAVRIYPLPPCDSEAGSSLAIEPAGTTQVTYFAGGFPSKTATSASKGEAFSGIVSNVDVGVPVKVTVTSPTCEQLAFPIEYDGVTLTGVQQAEVGKVVPYMRVFIGPKKIVDAGAD